MNSLLSSLEWPTLQLRRERALAPRAIPEWNQMPLDILHADSLDSFKNLPYQYYNTIVWEKFAVGNIHE